MTKKGKAGCSESCTPGLEGGVWKRNLVFKNFLAKRTPTNKPDEVNACNTRKNAPCSYLTETEAGPVSLLPLLPAVLHLNVLTL